MAYMNQEKKAKVAALVKPILAKYGVKGSLAVRNNMTLVLTLREGKLDFIADMQPRFEFGAEIQRDEAEMRKQYHFGVNPYWYEQNYMGQSRQFLSEIIPAMHGAEWYDRSDIQTDYFDTAYYVDVNVGTWEKPYILKVA